MSAIPVLLTGTGRTPLIRMMQICAILKKHGFPSRGLFSSEKKPASTKQFLVTDRV